MKIAVIGLGTMGMGAALNLVRKGHQVFGCDVRDAVRAELATAGGTIVSQEGSSLRIMSAIRSNSASSATGP